MAGNIIDRTNDMVRVSELFMKGNNPTQIAKETGLTRVTVLKLIDDWRAWAQQDQDIMARARETLAIVDEHFGLLIKEAWTTLNQADADGNLVVKIQAIRALESLETNRAKAFRDAGLDDQGALIAQLNETERKQKILADILRDVTNDCPHCKTEVRKRLSAFTNHTEVVEVGPAEVTSGAD